MMTTKYSYIAYECVYSAQTMGRTNQERKIPCGAWNIQKSRFEPTDSATHQGRCKCGRKPKINRANSRWFDRKEDAQNYIISQLENRREQE